MAIMKSTREFERASTEEPAPEGAKETDAETDPATDSAPKLGRQQERSQMSTSRLLAAAAELFAERGYRQTSLADIGKNAGYSHGLVTRRFGSKQGLIVALLDHMINDWTQRALAPSLERKTGIEGLRAFYDAFCRNATANSSNLRALESLMFEGLWGEAELQERLVVVQRHGQEQFRDLVESGIKAGTVRPDVDADAVALMAATSLRGATYCWLLDADFDLCATLRSFGDVLEDYLRPAA
jgi:AcrR family transcriptional regulator